MTLTLPRPTDKQREFLRARTKYVGFGGARGGGKSFGIRLKIQLLAAEYPGIRMLLLRRTYAELEENHIRPLRTATAGAARYNEGKKTLTYVNGSMVKFGYCDSEGDVDQYQGQEYDVLFFDEATHFTELMFTSICACCRGANRYPKRIYVTCNPGGVGHAWVKRLFVDRDYRAFERAEDYTFIRSYVYDNAPLLQYDPGYLQMLQSLPDGLRQAWLDGDWDAFAGQFFAEWRRDIHVIEPYPIPPGWTRVLAMDYGLDMLAVLWGAFDSHGNGVIYKEFCRSGLKVSDAAAEIKARCVPEEYRRDGKLVIAAPPDLWSRQKDTGKSIAELFGESGILLLRADNDRQGGWANVKEWLAVREDCDGSLGARLRFFSPCREVTRCLPLLQYSGRDSLDCATEPHDITHAPDALRYLLQSRPKRAKIPDARTAEEKWLDAVKRERISDSASRANRMI